MDQVEGGGLVGWLVFIAGVWEAGAFFLCVCSYEKDTKVAATSRAEHIDWFCIFLIYFYFRKTSVLMQSQVRALLSNNVARVGYLYRLLMAQHNPTAFVVHLYTKPLYCSTGASMSHCKPSPASTAGAKSPMPIIASISASSLNRLSWSKR